MPDEPVAHVHVDPDRCEGHTRCYGIAPDLFELDDLGYAHEIGDGAVSTDALERAELAVKNCPEYAVILERHGD